MISKSDCSCTNVSEPPSTKLKSTPSICVDCVCKPGTCNESCEEAQKCRHCPKFSKIPVLKNSTVCSSRKHPPTTTRKLDATQEVISTSEVTTPKVNTFSPACDNCECEPMSCNAECIEKNNVSSSKCGQELQKAKDESPDNNIESQKYVAPENEQANNPAIEEHHNHDISHKEQVKGSSKVDKTENVEKVDSDDSMESCNCSEPCTCGKPKEDEVKIYKFCDCDVVTSNSECEKEQTNDPALKEHQNCDNLDKEQVKDSSKVDKTENFEKVDTNANIEPCNCTETCTCGKPKEAEIKMYKFRDCDVGTCKSECENEQANDPAIKEHHNHDNTNKEQIKGSSEVNKTEDVEKVDTNANIEPCNCTKTCICLKSKEAQVKICKFCDCDVGTCNSQCEKAKKERIERFLSKSKDMPCEKCVCDEDSCNPLCETKMSGMAEEKSKVPEKATPLQESAAAVPEVSVETVLQSKELDHPVSTKNEGVDDPLINIVNKSSLKLKSPDSDEAADKTEKLKKTKCELHKTNSKISKSNITCECDFSPIDDKDIKTIKSKSQICRSGSQNFDECRKDVAIVHTESQAKALSMNKSVDVSCSKEVDNKNSGNVGTQKEASGKGGKKSEDKICEICKCSAPCHTLCEEIKKLKLLIVKPDAKICGECICKENMCNAQCLEKKSKAVGVNFNERPLTIDACVNCQCPEGVCWRACANEKALKAQRAGPIESEVSNQLEVRCPIDLTGYVCADCNPKQLTAKTYEGVCIPPGSNKSGKKEVVCGDIKSKNSNVVEICDCKPQCLPACKESKASFECEYAGPCKHICSKFNKNTSKHDVTTNIKQLTELLNKIKLSCVEAENISKRIKKQKCPASTSEMAMVMDMFEKKSKQKDIFINALINDVTARSASKKFDDLLNNIAHDTQSVVDFDRTAIANRLPRPPKICAKESKPCECTYTVPILDQMRITVVKKVAISSLKIRWIASENNSVTGYEVCIGGKIRGRVLNRLRTSILLDCLNLTNDQKIQVYAICKNKICGPPAEAKYRSAM